MKCVLLLVNYILFVGCFMALGNNTERFRRMQMLSDYVTLTCDTAEYLVEIGVKLVGIDYMTNL